MAEAQLLRDDALQILAEGDLTNSDTDDPKEEPITLSRTGTGTTIDRILVDPVTRVRIQKYANLSKGICSLPECPYQSKNTAAFYRHVESHNILYICDCGYYSSVRDTTTRHVRRIHLRDPATRITQVDRRNWTGARKVIAGLPHRMPRLPAHSNDAIKLKWGQGASKLIELSEVRNKLSAPPTSTSCKTQALETDRVAKPLVTLMAKPFLIEKIPTKSLVTITPNHQKIAQKEMRPLPPASRQQQKPVPLPRSNLAEEIRRRERRTAQLRTLLQEEDEDIKALERLQTETTALL